MKTVNLCRINVKYNRANTVFFENLFRRLNFIIYKQFFKIICYI